MTREPNASNAVGLGATVLLVAAVVIGAGLGWLCARYVFVGSWWALLVWAAAGVGIGLAAPDWRIAAIAGAIFGFVLGFVFMIAGYEGSAPLSGVLLPFAGLGAVAAVGGVLSAEVGWLLRRVIRGRPRSADGRPQG